MSCQGHSMEATGSWKRKERTANMITMTRRNFVTTTSATLVALALAACGNGEGASDTSRDIESEDRGESAHETVTVLCGPDVSILDKANDEMFGGDAKDGLRALIDDGMARVNGAAVNEGDVLVNGAPILWENEDGTWSWNAHPWAAHEENVSHEDACMNLLVGICGLAGLSYTVTLEDGQASAVDFLVQDVAVATDVSSAGGTTSVTLYAPGDNSMGRIDPTAIAYDDDLVEPDQSGQLPKGLCGVMFWRDAEGDHLRRCDSEVMDVPYDYQVNGTQINLEYSQPWNRPDQPVAAIAMAGFDSVQMTQYCINGYTCGWSYVDSRSLLPDLVEKAARALEETAVSEDGKGLDAGIPWVTADYHDKFQKLIEDTKAIEANGSLEPMAYDEAFYNLSIAYGGDGSFHALFGNIYEDGVGFVTFANSHE